MVPRENALGLSFEDLLTLVREHSSNILTLFGEWSANKSIEQYTRTLVNRISISSGARTPYLKRHGARVVCAFFLQHLPLVKRSSDR